MTDSVDRKTSPPMPEELKNKLAKIDRKDYTEFSDLPTYVRTACAMHEFMGMTWKEVADRLGKKPSTVEKYKRYPAYKAWREELKEASLDPKTMAEMALQSSSMGITLEYLAAFQKAIEAGDYDVTHKMAKDLLDRAGVTTKKSGNETAMTIKVTLGGSGEVEVPSVEAEWEVVEEDTSE